MNHTPSLPFQIRPLAYGDLAQWETMRCRLWPDLAQDPAAARRDAESLLTQPEVAVFVAQSAASSVDLLGFAECGERPYADGCDTAPVGYLEAWWVEPHARRQGVGRALVEAVAAWARDRGLRELASDTELDNLTGQHAHQRAGFAEVQRAVLYRRVL